MDLKEVVAKLEELAPSSTAEEWDNVGLLIEPCGSTRIEKIFLTNDLTEEVLDEALHLAGKRVGLIVSYHPPLFTPLKRLTQRSSKERILLKAIEAGVAIYSPHTAHDNLAGGVNDWLVSGLGEGRVRPLRVQQLAPIWPHRVVIRGVEGAEGVSALSHIVAREKCGEMVVRYVYGLGTRLVYSKPPAKSPFWYYNFITVKIEFVYLHNFTTLSLFPHHLLLWKPILLL